MPRLAASLAAALVILGLAAPGARAEKFPKGVSFKKDVVPVLVESCVACHNPKTKKGKYDMSTYAAIMKGGGKGAPIVPGKSAESLFSLMMHGDEEPAMPKDADLLPKEILARIDLWIDQGAKFDGDKETADVREMVPGKSSPAGPPVYARPAATTALAFSGDGKTLVVAGFHEITFWNVADGKFVRRLPIKSERVHALEYSPDGKLLVHAGGTPGKFGEVVVWDAIALAAVKELMKADDVVFTATFSPDGKQVAAGGVDRIFRIWNVADGKELHKVENHADWVLAASFTADGKRLFTASRDKSAKIWDQTTKEPVLTFSGHGEGVYGVAVSPDGKQAVSVGVDNHVRWWKPEGDAPAIRATPAHANTIFCLRYPRSGKLVFTAGGDATAKAWNPADGALVQIYSGAKDWIYSLAISPDDKLLAAGAWDGQVTIWDVATAKPTVSFVAVPPPTTTATAAASK